MYAETRLMDEEKEATMGQPGLFGLWGLGLRRRDKSSLDRPWGGPAVVRKLDRSVLKMEVGSWVRGL
jgi:hypothetical protein